MGNKGSKKGGGGGGGGQAAGQQQQQERPSNVERRVVDTNNAEAEVQVNDADEAKNADEHFSFW